MIRNLYPGPDHHQMLGEYSYNGTLMGTATQLLNGVKANELEGESQIFNDITS